MNLILTCKNVCAKSPDARTHVPRMYMNSVDANWSLIGDYGVVACSFQISVPFFMFILVYTGLSFRVFNITISLGNRSCNVTNKEKLYENPFFVFCSELYKCKINETLDIANFHTFKI